jgi:hypothetical protein
MSRVEDDILWVLVMSNKLQPKLQPGMVTYARLYVYGLRQGMIPSNHSSFRFEQRTSRR